MKSRILILMLILGSCRPYEYEIADKDARIAGLTDTVAILKDSVISMKQVVLDTTAKLQRVRVALEESTIQLQTAQTFPTSKDLSQDQVIATLKADITKLKSMVVKDSIIISADSRNYISLTKISTGRYSIGVTPTAKKVIDAYSIQQAP